MKLKYIDALRGYAVLGVLMVHCGMATRSPHLPSIVSNFIFQGSRGVQLFYIISAFTLFLSLQNSHKQEKYKYLSFFLRRFFRIAPMFYIAIAYYYFFNNSMALENTTDSSISFLNVLGHLFFIHGFNPKWINTIVPGGWSIAVEMLFYCFVPYLFLKIKNINQAFLFVLISLFIRHFLALLFSFSGLNGLDLYLYYYFPNQLPVFALGIFLYFLITEQKKLSPIYLFVILALFSLQLLGVRILPEYFLFSILFVFLAAILSKYPNKFLVNPLFEFVGKISFSMYLVHFGVLQLLINFKLVTFLNNTNAINEGLNFTIRFIILFISSALISFVTYNFVEKPMQEIGKKIIAKINSSKKNHLETSQLSQ